MIGLETRIGLLSYPEEVQRFIIKAKYFPIPSEETYLMIYLYLKDAISREKAIPLKEKENEIAKKLVVQEKVKKENRKRKGSILFIRRRHHNSKRRTSDLPGPEKTKRFNLTNLSFTFIIARP